MSKKKQEQKMSFFEFQSSFGPAEKEDLPPARPQGGSSYRRYDNPREGGDSEEGGQRTWGERKPYNRDQRREPRPQADMNSWSDRGYSWGPREGEEGKSHWDNVSRRKPKEGEEGEQPRRSYGGNFRSFNKDNQGEGESEQKEGETSEQPRRTWGEPRQTWGEPRQPRRYPPREQAEGEDGEKSDEPRQERRTWGEPRRYTPRGEGEDGERRGGYRNFGDRRRDEDATSWGSKPGFPEYSSRERRPYQRKEGEEGGESKDRKSVYDSYNKSEDKPASEGEKPATEEGEEKPSYRREGGSYRGGRGGFQRREEDKGLLQSSKKKYDLSWGESSGDHWQKPKPRDQAPTEAKEGEAPASEEKTEEKREPRHHEGHRGGHRGGRGGRGGRGRGGFHSGPRRHHQEEGEEGAPAESGPVEVNPYAALGADE